jgi:hypothetical protein
MEYYISFVICLMLLVLVLLLLLLLGLLLQKYRGSLFKLSVICFTVSYIVRRKSPRLRCRLTATLVLRGHR